ncbi:MAG: hypothetical protein Q8N98_03630 [bacterium]|nr:hypothetical protein [bacterium]
MIWLKINYNDPLLFLSSLSSWQKEKFIFPLQVFWRYLKIFTTVPVENYLFHVALFEFATAISFGALSVYLFFRRPSYGLFSALILLTVFSTGTLTSLPRYVLVIFPAFIALPLIFKTVKTRIAVVAGFLIIFAWSFVRFITGQWVA